MKKILATLLSLATLTFATLAAPVEISNVHLCCEKCCDAAKKMVATVPGVAADIDQDDGNIDLSGPDKASIQKAVDALVAGGFYGTTHADGITISADTGAKGVKVTTLTVTGVHLCCGDCVKAVKEALAKVPGVTGNTVAKGAKSFEVTGDFTDSDVFTALHKAGLNGKVE